MAIFDDVLVPWDRVFLHGNVDIGQHHVRAHRDAMSHRASDGGARPRQMRIHDRAGDRAVAQRQDRRLSCTCRSSSANASAICNSSKARSCCPSRKPKSSDHGTLRPALEPLQALRYHIPRFYERMVRLTQVLGAGGILANPTEADLRFRNRRRYPPLLSRRRSRRRGQNPSVETRLGRDRHAVRPAATAI